jgi:hypothetical protein
MKETDGMKELGEGKGALDTPRLLAVYQPNPESLF